MATAQQFSRRKYSTLPWYRRSGINTVFLVLHLLTLGLIPFLVITCVALVTGDIYYNKAEQDGSLKKWSFANKIIAALFLIPSVLIIGVFAVAIIGGIVRSLAS